LAYHRGEHYCSVRLIGDDLKIPAAFIPMDLPDELDEDELVPDENSSKIRESILKVRVKMRKMLKKFRNVKSKATTKIREMLWSKESKGSSIPKYFLFMSIIMITMKVFVIVE